MKSPQMASFSLSLSHTHTHSEKYLIFYRKKKRKNGVSGRYLDSMQCVKMLQAAIKDGDVSLVESLLKNDSNVDPNELVEITFDGTYSHEMDFSKMDSDQIVSMPLTLWTLLYPGRHGTDLLSSSATTWKH